MKVAIITLFGLENYGNRLQNYALQEVLCQMGCTVDTIIVSKDKNVVKRFIKKFFYKEEKNIKIIPFIDLKRRYAFSSSVKKRLKSRIIYATDGKIPTYINDEYDVFIVGSDQVWNPIFWKNDIYLSDFYNFMLKFASTEKRVAYAASFGISEIPDKWHEKVKDELLKFKNLSVREYEGADIIYKLTKRDIDVVLDPTMLLPPARWRIFEKCTNIKGYVLLYFLGEIDKKIMKFIKNYSLQRNLKIIDLMDRNKIYYTHGPEKFVNLIDNAAVVFTDSFHAAVFSIMFEIPFVVYDRIHSSGKSMLGRIDTLLKITSLENRKNLWNENEISNCDFVKAKNAIEIERKKSLLYLEKVLEKHDK